MTSDKVEKDSWEIFLEDNNNFNNNFPSNNNDNNNSTDNNLRISPQRALLNFLNEIECKLLGGYFYKLKYAPSKILKRILKDLIKEREFWFELFSELEFNTCGTLTQFLQKIEVDGHNYRYDRKYRLRVDRMFLFFKDLGIMNYESIDPKTHPLIKRHLNPTKFWFLRDCDEDAYKERLDAAVDSYIFAKSKLGKSAYADKQRIDEANGSSGSKKELTKDEKTQQSLQKQLNEGSKRIATCKECDKLYTTLPYGTTVVVNGRDYRGMYTTFDIETKKSSYKTCCKNCFEEFIKQERK